MRTETKDNKTIFYLEGRISSDNAGALQKEIEQALSAAPDTEPVMDATDLEYISSAGLRVLLQLAKQRGGSLTVQNVSSAVYEIFEMTGFTDILNVRKKCGSSA
ncbi:MAG: STAS domain-containing protein [Lachnospiraceae bacterium]|nr:STAS domain-containing protein [Lachnospiraceae bacterium]